MPDYVTAATEGLTFRAIGRKWTVRAKCTENNGHWYCITCKEGLRNQLEKDCHINASKHQLVWWCRVHDEPEVP